MFRDVLQKRSWRRGRDSNPRYPFGYAGFQDRSHQPLGHLSAVCRSSSIVRRIVLIDSAASGPTHPDGAQTEKRERAAPASCSRIASNVCLLVDRPGYSRHRSCADPQASRRSGLRQRGSLCRHIQSRRPATQYRRRRSDPTSSPSRFTTGEPELPPMISPCKRNRAEWPDRVCRGPLPALGVKSNGGWLLKLAARS